MYNSPDSLTYKLEQLKLDHKPFTLYTFLAIYTKANNECYIHYMEGAKLLYSYLTSYGAIPLDFQVGKYPDIDNENFTPIRLADGGYEADRLAMILSPKIANSNHSKAYYRARRAIYLTARDLL